MIESVLGQLADEETTIKYRIVYAWGSQAGLLRRHPEGFVLVPRPASPWGTGIAVDRIVSVEFASRERGKEPIWRLGAENCLDPERPWIQSFRRTDPTGVLLADAMRSLPPV